MAMVICADVDLQKADNLKQYSMGTWYIASLIFPRTVKTLGEFGKLYALEG